MTETTYKVVPMTEADLAAQRAKHAEVNDTPPATPSDLPDCEKPPQKLPVGAKVVFTNDYGISWPGYVIARVERDEYGDAYYTEPKPGSAHWSPKRRRHLTLQGGV